MPAGEERPLLVGKASKEGYSVGDSALSSSASGQAPSLAIVQGNDSERGDFSVFEQRFIAIVYTYVICGFVPGFLMNPISVHLVRVLNASPVEQNTIQAIMVLPWCFKVLFGLVSDLCPLMDRRRKSYLFVGNSLSMVGLTYLAAVCYDNTVTVASMGITLLFVTLGVILCDVMCDTLCVELSQKHEGVGQVGQLQSLVYQWRYAAGFIGNLGGTLFYNKHDWGWGLHIGTIFTICALCQLFGTFFLYNLEEETVSSRSARGEAPESASKQMTTLRKTLEQNAVWKSMLYIYFYNFLQVPNAAWTSFLLKGLKFTSFELGMQSSIASLAVVLGMWIYRNFMLEMSWRAVYITTTIIGGILSLLQLLIVYRVNVDIGINDFWFSLGDNVISAFVMGCQYLPSAIMMVSLCPKDSEGTSYALFTTLGNVGLSVGLVIGNVLVLIWDCSNAAMEKQDYSGLGKLTLLTTAFQVFPIFFVGFLPESVAELKAMTGQSSFWGGTLVLILFASILTSILNVVVAL